MRTIILQEVASPHGGAVYWSINENGRQTEGLGADELLWAVSCALRALDGKKPYGGGMTLEQQKITAFREGAICGLNGDTLAIEVRGRAALAPGLREFIQDDSPKINSAEIIQHAPHATTET